ncbi:MAG: Maf family protein, partial [Fibrobacterota bacterium]
KLFLASKSPRRSRILSKAGIQFETIENNAEEPDYSGGLPENFAISLAKIKAEAASVKIKDGIIMAFDTVVWFRGAPLGKPSSSKEASNILKKLSGNEHSVYTGICILLNPEMDIITDSEKTDVRFSDLPERIIREYINSREPLDKAGSYGIQGRGALFTESIRGCYYNVVGLPLNKTMKILEKRALIF